MMRLPDDNFLKKTHTVAAIISLIGIPIVIAIVGWWLQASLTSESLKKDYVQIAIGILADSNTKNEYELRQWAANVLSKNSPVPFSNKLKNEIVIGKTLSMFAWSAYPEAPKDLMIPPAKFNTDEAVRLKNLQNWVKEQHIKNQSPNRIPKWLIPQNSKPYGPITDKEREVLFNESLNRH
jgi:hypothetical protein